MNGVYCIIPSRLGSTRLPRKSLAEIEGIPLVVWAMRSAESSGAFEKVVVATDSDEIVHAVEKHGGCAVMTAADHASGTDRVYEAARQLNPAFVVNLQGDEPQMPAEVLNAFAGMVCLEANENCLITSATHATIDDKANPNSVKIAMNGRAEALYFSRAPIPYVREGVASGYWKHTGIYGFSMAGLARFCSFDPGVLEQAEKLEQLRALENGMKIKCLKSECETHGIDTAEDLERFKQHIRELTKHTYK